MLLSAFRAALLAAATMAASTMGALALASALASAPARAQAPAAPEAPVATWPVPDLDIVVRVPLDQDPVWRPPDWSMPDTGSLALQPEGEQIVAMFESFRDEFQPSFDEEHTATIGAALCQAYVDDAYAGPELGAVTWEAPVFVRHPRLGDHIRCAAAVVLPDRPEDAGRLMVAIFPVRAGMNGLAIVGVAPPERMVAAADSLADMVTFYDGPLPWKDMAAGHVSDGAGYELDLPEAWRGLTEKERTALRGEPVGGNSGFGGALAHQMYFDPRSLAGAQNFGCVAFSADTLEIVAPEKARRLADNYRLAARLILKAGTYKVDGGKPIRGRPADLFDGRTLSVALDQQDGALEILPLGERDGYFWRTQGKRLGADGVEEPVELATFYTAWSDVNLHCQADAPLGDTAELDLFRTAMASVRVTDGTAHPIHMGLMARYKRWWPYTNPLLQLYWLPIPIVLFAAWLASRGD